MTVRFAVATAADTASEIPHATAAGVNRTGFYPKKNRDGTTRPGAHQHLAEEDERKPGRQQQPRTTSRPSARVVRAGRGS